MNKTTTNQFTKTNCHLDRQIHTTIKDIKMGKNSSPNNNFSVPSTSRISKITVIKISNIWARETSRHTKTNSILIRAIKIIKLEWVTKANLLNNLSHTNKIIKTMDITWINKIAINHMEWIIMHKSSLIKIRICTKKI